MSDISVGRQRIDSSKRTWLIASGCAGAVGGVATAIPFVSTFQPSEKPRQPVRRSRSTSVVYSRARS